MNLLSSTNRKTEFTLKETTIAPLNHLLHFLSPFLTNQFVQPHSHLGHSNYALKFFTQPSTQVEGSSLNITFYCLSSIRSLHNFPEFQHQLAFPSSFSNDHFYKSYFPWQSFRPNIFTVFSFQHLATKLPSSSPLIYFYFWSHYFLLCFVLHKDMARSNGHNERFNGRVTVKI